jgi:hypothetical protein
MWSYGFSKHAKDRDGKTVESDETFSYRFVSLFPEPVGVITMKQ